MSQQEPDERRSWFPLALAGGFVAFALIVAVVAFVANRHGDPSKAVSVDDVAELSIEAVDRADRDFAAELACGDATAELTAFASQPDARATKSKLTGVEEGSFRLTVELEDSSTAYDVKVSRDGARSCIESMTVVAGEG